MTERLSAVLLAPWNRPGSPLLLGLFRIAAGLYVLYYVNGQWRSLIQIHDQPLAQWAPFGVAALMPRPPTPTEVEGLLWVTLVSGILFVVGAGWRVVAPIFVAAAFTVLSLRCSWGLLFHHLHLVGLHLLVLGAAASAGALSVDDWLRGRVPDWLVGPALDPAGDVRAGWPLRLGAAITAITYFVAGVAKIAHGGHGWLAGTNLRDQVGKDALNRLLYVRDFDTSIVDFVYANPQWLWFGAWVTMVVELGAPLYLLFPRLAVPWIIGAIAMHAGIYVIMDILFSYPAYGLAFVCVAAMDPAVGGLFVRLHQRFSGGQASGASVGTG